MATSILDKSVQAKQCTADEAAALVHSGATVVCGGFVGAGHPEALTAALERRFLAEKQPRDLSLVYAAGQGDGKSRGLNHLGHEGLIRRVIGGHWGLAPSLGRLAIDGLIEAYNFPQGVVCQLLRDIAAGRPGCITHVGLGTFVDPEIQGGRLNDNTPADLVERVHLSGRTWLFYHSFPVHVGLIRATAADPHGNLTMDEEAMFGEVLPIAQAVHNHGGKVIAQVKRLESNPAHPHRVKVPGMLVDHIVVAGLEEHSQTFAEPLNPEYCCAGNVSKCQPDTSLRGVRRIIAERVCDELQPGDIVNLGIGMPEGVAVVAAERVLLGRITLTLESGPIGGLPAGGLSFGASRFPEAVIDQPAQFDFYDGGGLDFAALGAAQVDELGHVNVSRFGDRLAGVGGFVNISQNAKRVVFCGTLTSGGFEAEVRSGKLVILREGVTRKFVDRVTSISFDGRQSRRADREVLYVTERCVFRLGVQGMELVEVAPGIDPVEQILPLLGFRPAMGALRPMTGSLFTPQTSP